MKEEEGEADDKGDDADKKKIESESQDTVAARETEKDKAAGS